MKSRFRNWWPISSRITRSARRASALRTRSSRKWRSSTERGASGIVIGMKLSLPILLCASAWAQNADVVVYGGTAGGAMTAISAARQGLKVTLLEPGKHIGGMVTGGLSRTDIGRREAIRGCPPDVY